MIKDATYTQKMTLLQEWLPSILETIKRDLKNEHLLKDRQFVKTYFSNKNIGKLSVPELVEGYAKALSNDEKAEALAEFIAHHWLMKHSDVYHYFEMELKRMTPNFTEIEELQQDHAIRLMESASKEFGAQTTYTFSIFNSVVFPASIYEQLKKRAQNEAKEEIVANKALEEKQSLETMQQNHEQQIARLTDKYEKKLQGLQKMYKQDTESLKKQIAALQRKLHA